MPPVSGRSNQGSGFRLTWFPGAAMIAQNVEIGMRGLRVGNEPGRRRVHFDGPLFGVPRGGYSNSGGGHKPLRCMFTRPELVDFAGVATKRTG